MKQTYVISVRNKDLDSLTKEYAEGIESFSPDILFEELVRGAAKACRNKQKLERLHEDLCATPAQAPEELPKKDNTPKVRCANCGRSDLSMVDNIRSVTPIDVLKDFSVSY